MINYQNKKDYKGDLSASDLCDAIVEASQVDIAEVAEAKKLLIEDLRDAILSDDTIYYLTSKFTNSPYVNERYSLPIFTVKELADDFVKAHSVWGVLVNSVKQKDYKEFFSSVYNYGIDGIEYYNDESHVSMGLEAYFLSEDHVFSNAPARSLSRFVLLGMQEIRNVEKQYDNKAYIIDLLKKNIIAEGIVSNVFVPVQTDIQSDSDILTVPEGASVKVVTMSNESGKLFFPVYLNLEEYSKNKIPGIKIVPSSLLNFIKMVNGISDPNIIGVIVNPNAVGFAMNKDIMNLILENAR
jgi:hypothetical protein